jgi:hypothetical protein
MWLPSSCGISAQLGQNETHSLCSHSLTRLANRRRLTYRGSSAAGGMPLLGARRKTPMLCQRFAPVDPNPLIRLIAPLQQLMFDLRPARFQEARKLRTVMPSTPGAPLLRTTGRTAASMLSGSQITSIRLAVGAGLSGGRHNRQGSRMMDPVLRRDSSSACAAPTCASGKLRTPSAVRALRCSASNSAATRLSRSDCSAR